MSYSDLVLRLFLQLAIILVFCHIATYIGKRFFGQTSVVCEMIAGILLGPSLLGLLFPDFQSWLFPIHPLTLANGVTIPNPSMSILYAISQIGLILYMFLVGLDFNISIIKQRYKAAGLISGFGMIAPFALGMLLTSTLPDSLQLFNPHVSDNARAIFLGASLSITAFPVMARILEEKNASRSHFGTLALAAGSLGDLFAWVILAILLSSLHENINLAALAVSGVIIYAVLMCLIKKPIKKLLLPANPSGVVSTQTLTMVFLVLMICAWFTDRVGIYSVFGAFIAGIIMPRDALFVEVIRTRMRDFTSVLLLPIFFVFSGLNTQIHLLNTTYMWLALAAITLAAIIGKGIACMIAARLMGEKWQDALAIGTLMNARGLMELIIINIGLQQGIITPTLFTILVMMAIVTTLMTSPLYQLISRHKKALSVMQATV